MKFKKSCVIVLIFIGILVLAVGTIYASSFGSNDKEVIINDVVFVLNYTSDIGIYSSDVVSFNVGYDIYGFIYEIDNGQTLKFYTQEDSSRKYYTRKCDSDILNGDLYSFANGDEDNCGYFLIFNKDNKKFVYKICTDMSHRNETVDTMLSSMHLFAFDNNLILMEPVDGKTFVDCKEYFPGASKTVLTHVFNEADNNGDGVLSDSEFAKFKKVRDHTKKYAEDITNNYPTKTAKGKGTGYCADHGRVKLNSKNQCPYCLKLHYDPITKTSAW